MHSRTTGRQSIPLLSISIPGVLVSRALGNPSSCCAYTGVYSVALIPSTSLAMQGANIPALGQKGQHSVRCDIIEKVASGNLIQ